jgi:hypothetical protein
VFEFRRRRLVVVLKLFEEVDILVERGGDHFGVLPDTAERVAKLVRGHVEEHFCSTGASEMSVLRGDRE